MIRKTLKEPVLSVVIAGLGGQGVLKASDILSDLVFRTGLDVKKSEVHGMSQRGGSVHSDIRWGSEVFSPMVPVGEADFVLVLTEDQVENNRHRLKPGGKLLSPQDLPEAAKTNERSLNVALLGLLSASLDLKESLWKEAIDAAFPPALRETNWQVFLSARNGG